MAVSSKQSLSELVAQINTGLRNRNVYIRVRNTRINQAIAEILYEEGLISSFGSSSDEVEVGGHRFAMNKEMWQDAREYESNYHGGQKVNVNSTRLNSEILKGDNGNVNILSRSAINFQMPLDQIIAAPSTPSDFGWIYILPKYKMGVPLLRELSVFGSSSIQTTVNAVVLNKLQSALGGQGFYIISTSSGIFPSHKLILYASTMREWVLQGGNILLKISV